MPNQCTKRQWQNLYQNKQWQGGQLLRDIIGGWHWPPSSVCVDVHVFLDTHVRTYTHAHICTHNLWVPADLGNKLIFRITPHWCVNPGNTTMNIQQVQRTGYCYEHCNERLPSPSDSVWLWSNLPSQISPQTWLVGQGRWTFPTGH